ncbi:MAG: ExbD/TolR family protein [Pirellulaceae bacterium]
MRLTRVRRPSNLGMNMTPMIDIVFLLIIFFMAVAQITQSLDHPIELTDVGSGGDTLDTVAITINLDTQGRLIVAGQPFSMDELMAAIQGERKRAETDSSRIRILIRCDRNCPGASFNALTDRLSQEGFRSVRLSVEGDDTQ